MNDSWFYVDAFGVAYNLYDPANGVFLDNISGIAIPSVKNFESVAPLQDGATWRGMRLEPRVISATFYILNNSRQALFDARHNWISRLRPGQSTGKLRCVKPDGATFEMDVRYQGGFGIGFGRDSVNPTDQKVGVQWIAYNPVWRLATQSTFDFTFSLSRLTLTFTLTATISGGYQTSQQNIAVAGSWKSYPVITLTGPMASPKIENLTLGQEISIGLGGFAVAIGQTAVIDLTPNVKTVKDGATDYTGYVTPDSDLTDFYLADPTEVAGGINQIRVSAFDMNSNSKFAFAWYNKFLGL